MIGNLAKAEDHLRNHESLAILFDKNEGDNDEEMILTPFPTSNRLCSIFTEIEYESNKKFRLSFDLPAVYPPVILFET